MRKNKKGALQLSINAIVIIVLAMTVLGLGLTFTRGLFRKMSGLTDDTFEKIKEELNTKLDTGEEQLVFSTTRLDIPRGGQALEGFGFRNDGNSEMKIGIRFFPVELPPSASVDVDDMESEWFHYLSQAEAYRIGPGSRTIKDILITVPRSAKTGLYLIKMVAYEGSPKGSSCASLNNCPGELASTEIFLTVG